MGTHPISSPWVSQAAPPSPGEEVGTVYNLGQSDSLRRAGYFLQLLLKEIIHGFLPSASFEPPRPQDTLHLSALSYQLESLSMACNQRTSNDTPGLHTVELHFSWWVSQCFQTKPLLNQVKGNRGTDFGFQKVRHD